MPVLKPANRTISFRLSEDDYRSLVQLSEATGARSTSEVARAAVHEYLTKARKENPPVLVERLERIEENVKRLNRFTEILVSLGKGEA